MVWIHHRQERRGRRGRKRRRGGQTGTQGERNRLGWVGVGNVGQDVLLSVGERAHSIRDPGVSEIVEDSGASFYNQIGAGVPGDTEPRREVVLFRVPQWRSRRSQYRRRKVIETQHG